MYDRFHQLISSQPHDTQPSPTVISSHHPVFSHIIHILYTFTYITRWYIVWAIYHTLHVCRHVNPTHFALKPSVPDFGPPGSTLSSIPQHTATVRVMSYVSQLYPDPRYPDPMYTMYMGQYSPPDIHPASYRPWIHQRAVYVCMCMYTLHGGYSYIHIAVGSGYP